MKGNKALIFLIAAIIIIMAGTYYAQNNKKSPADFTPTFYNTDTKPLGTYICYKLLKDVFPDAKVRSSRKTIYKNLRDTLGNYFDYDDYSYEYDDEYDYEDYESGDDYDDYSYQDEEDSTYQYDPESAYDDANEYIEDTVSIDRGTNEYLKTHIYTDITISDTTSYLFVSTRFAIDKMELEYLLDFAGIGNNIFISAEDISPSLLDTLHIGTKNLYFGVDTLYTLIDSPDKSYTFPRVFHTTKFMLDSCKLPVRVLATNTHGDIVFIRVQYGNGYIYLHTIPTAFANYHLLNIKKYDFGFRCLSYMPRKGTVIWDEYQKQGPVSNKSMFRVMLDSPPLKAALWLTLLGFLLFMIFRAKRTQRIIPIVQPPVNSSLEFLETISNLRYKKKDFVGIVERRHAFFLDYVRKHYYMSTEIIDADFLKTLSSKSGVDIESLNHLMGLYKDIRGMYDISNAMFLEYNKQLEKFYQKVENIKK